MRCGRVREESGKQGGVGGKGRGQAVKATPCVTLNFPSNSLCIFEQQSTLNFGSHSAPDVDSGSGLHIETEFGLVEICALATAIVIIYINRRQTFMSTGLISLNSGQFLLLLSTGVISM